MPRKATGGSPRTVKNHRSETAEQIKPHAPPKASPLKYKTSPETTLQQPLALNDSAEVENIRRANLHVLTNRNGSKARLGVVMAMSGSNMAHRLHGKKRMDSVEANRFTEQLGLPAGWLDTPRSEAEIPESVSRMLAPASRGRVSAQPHEPLATVTNDGVAAKPADVKVHKGRARTDAPGDSESPSPVLADVAGEKETIVVSPQDHVNALPGDFPDDLAGRSLEESHGEAPAATPAPPEVAPHLRTIAARPGTAPLRFGDQPGQSSRYRTDSGSIAQDAGR